MEDRPDASHPGGFSLPGRMAALCAGAASQTLYKFTQRSWFRRPARFSKSAACPLRLLAQDSFLLGPFSRKTYFCFRLCLFLDELFVNFDIFWNLYFLLWQLLGGIPSVNIPLNLII
ncbi:hypothetical protein V6L76_17135 [Pannonibacter sp. Pt2]|uniref:Uncharacterized protein n=1 Tax=Pannonibacter anstelovis TaxID=3121537 RepID=A0ABU7ZRY6_9HYPH